MALVNTETDLALRRTDARAATACLLNIWQGHNLPEGFDAGDAIRLVYLGWVTMNSKGGLKLTDSGLSALNLAESMYEKGKADGISTETSTGV